MEGEVTTPHILVRPDELAPGRGFSHAVVANAGRTVWIAGEIGIDSEGRVVDGGWMAQFDQALANVATALAAGDADPGHVVSMQIFTTDIAAYRDAAPDLGPIYRRHFGRHYPAMAAIGVTELVEPAAVVEIMATAVIPTE
jgi:enamine deaminase RidA (YjgF/YER057c/UK114 family)